MAKRLTFFDHIRLSVRHDTAKRIGHRLVLTLGDEIMIVTLNDGKEALRDEVADVTIEVTGGVGGYRTACGNTTDRVAGMWA